MAKKLDQTKTVKATVKVITKKIAKSTTKVYSASKEDSNKNAIDEIIIGTQTWCMKNLDVSTYRNGDAIPQVQDADSWAKLNTGAWCYYENETSNGTTYGKLYNWYAVNDPRGLAPLGYHIPTDIEWTLLTDYLGGKDLAGSKMKNTSGWKEDGDGTNSTSFTGLPGGYRNNDGTFDDVGTSGIWWSSTENNAASAWFFQLGCYDGNSYRNKDSKQSGNSVRCLRD